MIVDLRSSVVKVTYIKLVFPEPARVRERYHEDGCETNFRYPHFPLIHNREPFAFHSAKTLPQKTCCGSVLMYFTRAISWLGDGLQIRRAEPLATPGLSFFFFFLINLYSGVTDPRSRPVVVQSELPRLRERSYVRTPRIVRKQEKRLV